MTMGRATSILLSACIGVFVASPSNGQGTGERTQVEDISDTERENWVDGLKPFDWLTTTPKASIKHPKGYPEIFVGTEKLPVLSSYFGYIHDSWGYTHKPAEFHDAYAKELAETGIMNNVQLPVSVMVPGNSVDLSRARQISRKILEINPAAKFVIRCQLFATPAFATKHPDQIVLFEDGTDSHWLSPTRTNAKQPRYSLSSRVFERECALGLKTMLEKLKDEPYQERIYAILISIGGTGEFNNWLEFDLKVHAIDYSPVMTQRFAQFVQSLYANDLGRLRKAWREPDAVFEEVRLPSKAERGVDAPSSVNEDTYMVPNTLGFFRNPDAHGSQKVCDYYDCLNRETSARLAYLCRVVKKLSGNSLLAGGFLGGPLTISGYHWEGQTAFNEVIASPDVDLIATPWTYEGRSLGENLFFRSPLQSYDLRNKLYWIECDTRTSLSVEKGNYGAAATVAGDVERLKMDLIRLATTSAYGYWFEMRVGWYAAKEHHAIMRKIAEIGKFAVACDRSRNAQIALFYDEKSIYQMSEWLNFLLNARQIIQDFGYVGADYDAYSTEDIGRIDLTPYKLVVFPNYVRVDNAKRGLINDRLKRDGRTIVWLYGCGLVNPDKEDGKCSYANMEDLSGFKMSYINERMSPRMAVEPGADGNLRLPGSLLIGEFTRPVTSGHGRYSPENPLPLKPLQVFPQFAVDDAASIGIARYLDSKAVGFAVKNMGKWRSVYYGSPAFSAEALRAIARTADVHLYLDTSDIVYHNKSFLGVHATSAGQKSIRLPMKSDVYDLFNDKLIGEGLLEFMVDMGKNETFLFYTGNYSDIVKWHTKH